VREYFEAQRAIVDSGMKTTATMVIGFDETLDERLEHLQRTRDFQDECLRDGLDGCSRSSAGRTSRTAPRSAAARSRRDEYRRWIALSRIFLDNVTHVRTSVLTQNEDAFRALDYGADDFDLPIEDEVTQKAGARSTSTSRRCSRCRGVSATRSSTGTPSGPPRSPPRRLASCRTLGPCRSREAIEHARFEQATLRLQRVLDDANSR
jgi:2-iminoacetate synthase ThiH